MWKFLFSGSWIMYHPLLPHESHMSLWQSVSCDMWIAHPKFPVRWYSCCFSHTFIPNLPNNQWWKVRAETTFPGQRDNTIYCLWVRTLHFSHVITREFMARAFSSILNGRRLAVKRKSAMRELAVTKSVCTWYCFILWVFFFKCLHISILCF